jgi:hypothetical protein
MLMLQVIEVGSRGDAKSVKKLKDELIKHGS